MRFHYAYVLPWGETDIVILDQCADDNCDRRFHLAIVDAGERRHAPDCKCSNCYIPKV